MDETNSLLSKSKVVEHFKGNYKFKIVYFLFISPFGISAGYQSGDN